MHYVPWALNNHTPPLLTAFKKLPQQVKENYGECIKSLQRRFDPDSKRSLYMAELNTRTRCRNEDWPTFGNALRIQLRG